MSDYWPSSPFIVVGAVTTGNATAIMQEALLALSDVGAQPVSSQEGQNSRRLVSPDAGPLILRCIFEERVESYVGTELWVSGDLLGSPLWIELSPDQIAERERIRSFVQAAFLSSCDRLWPVYAGVGVEWGVIPPRKLKIEARLPGDLFWSSKLDKIDPTLAPDLAGIYGSPGRAFSHGTLIEADVVLNAESRPPAKPIAAGRAAAKRLGCTMASVEGEQNHQDLKPR